MEERQSLATLLTVGPKQEAEQMERRLLTVLPHRVAFPFGELTDYLMKQDVELVRLMNNRNIEKIRREIQ